MLRKGTKVIVPKNVQDESVINRSNIIPPTQRWYEINTEYFLTNKPDFINVPFVTIYHFENDENRVDDIKFYLNYRIEFNNPNTFEMCRRCATMFTENFRMLIDLCGNIRYCRSFSREWFEYFSNVVEIYLKKICSEPMNISVDVVPMKYNRPFTKSARYDRSCDITADSSDPLYRYIDIYHTVKDEDVHDFTISPNGEICFYQLKLPYKSTSYDKKNGTYIMDTLIRLADFYKEYNSMGISSSKWMDLSNLINSYTENISGSNIIGD